VDRRIRERERRSRDGYGDDKEAAQRARIRAGLVDPLNVSIAAALGCEVAKGAGELEGVTCTCSREFRGSCYRCGGSGRVYIASDFMTAVSAISDRIQASVLTRWANDCAAHANMKHIDVIVAFPTTPTEAIRLVKFAYRVSGYSKVERDWQRERLYDLLLDG